MSWSARQYVEFEDERTRAVHDLLNAVPDLPVRHAVDLGCGPGNSTAVLAARYPDASLLAIDSSADMLAAARRRLPQVRFELADVNDWQPAGPVELILANAVLQWVADHERVLPALLRTLTPGGALAIQMPDNLDTPAHALMRELALSGPWSGKLAQAAATRTTLADASWYYERLRAHARRADVWRTTYHHPLAGGAPAIAEWFKGSGLRPFLAPLDPGERAEYLAQYTAALARAYPALPDGSVLLPFPRLFMVAVR